MVGLFDADVIQFNISRKLRVSSSGPNGSTGKNRHLSYGLPIAIVKKAIVWIDGLEISDEDDEIVQNLSTYNYKLNMFLVRSDV
jgi:hypothetical protein